MSRYLTSVAENAVGKHGRVHVAGIPIAPGSLFAYTVTASTVLLVGLMPVVGAIADRTGRKRDIMLGCGWFGAAACIAMFAVTGSNWQLGAVLYALAFLGYSCSIVVSYSLLVDLSSHDDRDRASSVGWAISYIGGGLLLAADFVLSLFIGKELLARVALCTAGIWWILFSLPVLRRLPAVIGAGVDASRRDKAISEGFRQLARTIRHMRGYPLTLAFLGAFLIYNDGIQTVTTVAAQYGDKQLQLSDTVLLLAILLVQFLSAPVRRTPSRMTHQNDNSKPAGLLGLPPDRRRLHRHDRREGVDRRSSTGAPLPWNRSDYPRPTAFSRWLASFDPIAGSR